MEVINSMQSVKHILNIIVTQSKEKIQQNKIVKQMFTPYITQKFIQLKADMLLQTGIKNNLSNAVELKNQNQSNQKPSPNEKDKNCFYSVKKEQQQKKENTFHSTQKQLPTKAKRNKFYSFKHSAKIKSSSFNVDENTAHTKASLHKDNQQKQKVLNNFFILQDESPKNISRLQKKQDNQIDQLRTRITQRQIDAKNEIQQKQIDEKMKVQRQEKLSSYLQNHISKPKNAFTFDIEGSMLLYNTNKSNYRKQYPHKIRYQIQNDQQCSLRQKKNNGRANKYNKHYSQIDFAHNKSQSSQNYKLQGARGQIFKSSVLKTVNLSRMSLGNQMDQLQFMKRNDLFNNNHCRQTTSIPFIQLQHGISLKESVTNQKVTNSKQDTENNSKLQKQMKNKKARSQGRARSQFIKYSSQNGAYSSHKKCFFNPETKINYLQMNPNTDQQDKMHNTELSNLTYKRPSTSEVGRIKKQSQQLFLSMFS